MPLLRGARSMESAWLPRPLQQEKIYKGSIFNKECFKLWNVQRGRAHWASDFRRQVHEQFRKNMWFKGSIDYEQVAFWRGLRTQKINLTAHRSWTYVQVSPADSQNCQEPSPQLAMEPKARVCFFFCSVWWMIGWREVKMAPRCVQVLSFF